MRLRPTVLLLTALVGGSTLAAPPPERRAVYEQYLEFASLVDSCRPEAHWIEGGQALWRTRIGAEGRELLRVDPRSGAETPLFDVARLRATLTADLGRAPLEAGVPFASVELSADGHSAEFAVEGQRYALDRSSYALTRLRAPDPMEDFFEISARVRNTPRSFKREIYMSGEVPQDEVLSPDGRWFASLRNYDIWLRSTLDGRSVRITTGGTRDIAWDFETGAQNPWSPDGQTLFAAHIDRSRVFKVPQVHFLKRDEELDLVRLQKAGEPLDRYALFLVSAIGAEPIPVDIGDTTDTYIRLLGWRPDGSEVLFVRYPREFHRVDVLAANSRTGAVRTVYSETSPTFVRVQHDILWGGDNGFTLLPDGRGFLWQSERSGWNQLYLYGIDGKLIRPLTRDPRPVRAVVRVDATFVYYTARGGARPYDTHLFRVPLAGGRAEQLTAGDGEHQVQFSPSGEYFLDTRSTVAEPPVTELRSREGRLLGTYARADIARLRRAGWTPPEQFTVKAADGVTDLWGVLYKPYDFDASRSYPVIEYIYGGPQTIFTPQTFCVGGSRPRQFAQALAQLGYLVVILDARGTPGRSKAFHDVVHGHWADHVIPDHAAAIRELTRTRPYVDLQRVGIFGRSWGGYYAFRGLTDAPDLYKAAVSVVPGFDPYNGILYEPYLGLPQANKAAYEAANVFKLAPKVQGAFMMAGGTIDTSTYTDLMRMSAALIDAGKPYDFLILPNQDHQQVGQAADYLQDAIARFFEKSLHPYAATTP